MRLLVLKGYDSTVCRHLNSLDDPMTRTKWMNVKKAIMEETEVVKQLDAERRAFKEAPTGRSRAASPPINSTKSSFVFQPLDEYPTSSSGAPMDDPDVWRPPTRDVSTRRPARPGMRKSPQDGAWARGGGGGAGLLRFSLPICKARRIWKKKFVLKIKDNGYKDSFSLNHEHSLSLMNMT